MEHPDFDRAELPELANYLAVWLLGMRDWCPSCHGRGSIPDPDAPDDAAKTVKCERCESRRWMGAIDLERLLVTLSQHRREVSLNVAYGANGDAVWSAEDKDDALVVQEADPLHATYRLAAKVIAGLEQQGALNRSQPTDFIGH